MKEYSLQTIQAEKMRGENHHKKFAYVISLFTQWILHNICN